MSGIRPSETQPQNKNNGAKRSINDNSWHIQCFFFKICLKPNITGINESQKKYLWNGAAFRNLCNEAGLSILKQFIYN